jgi:hypothetical protein
MLSRTVRIAILECDTPLDQTQARYGGYGGVFAALMTKAAETLTSRGEPVTVEIESFNVMNDAYPDFEDGVGNDKQPWDGVMLTGSSM